jgi:hypothetical protein
MVAELGARDRPIMAGLVVLGILTVMAGVFSGRTTLQYALAKDASDAAIHWAKEADAQLHASGGASGEVLGKTLDRLKPEQFDTLLSGFKPESGQIGGDQLPNKWAAGLERFILDFLFARPDQAAGEHVSTLQGIAVVDADGALMATASVPPALVSVLLGDAAVAADFDNALDQVQGFYYGKPEHLAPADREADALNRPLVA